MNRRILSMLLALSVCFSIMTVPAYAEENAESAESAALTEENTETEAEPLPEDNSVTGEDVSAEEQAAENDDAKTAAEESEEETAAAEETAAEEAVSEETNAVKEESEENTSEEPTAETAEAENTAAENETEQTVLEGNEEEIDSEDAEFSSTGSCGTSVNYYLNANGELSITGSGAMTDYAASKVPWYTKRAAIRSVTIASGVTYISQYAFYQCTSLTSITLPETVTSIGKAAFSGCTGLQSVYIPGNAPTIASNAFTNVTATVYYVQSTNTWTKSNMTDYGGTLTWAGYVPYYDNMAAFVTLLYQNCLGRAPSSSEQESQVEKLIKGTAAGRTIALALLTGTEYTSKNYCDECFVKSLFPVCKNRAAKTSEIETWVSYLSAHRSAAARAYVVNSLLNASDFETLCTSYHVTAGDSASLSSLAFGSSGTCGSCGTFIAPVLTAAVQNKSKVTVTWESVDGASSYILYRKVSGGSWGVLKSGLTSTSYVDTEAKTAGTTYLYTIRAYVNGVKSSYDFVGLSLTYLASPKLSGASMSGSGITVTWTAVTGATGYNVYRKVSGGSWGLIGTSAKASYTDTASLTNGTTYYYTVRATNGDSISSFYSAGVSAEFEAGPTLLSAVQSKSTVTVKWSAVSGAKNYKLYYKAGSSDSWHSITTTTSTSYADTSSRTAGTTYYYTVRAYVDGAWGYYDHTGIALTYLGTPALTSAADGANGIIVKWSAVTGATGYTVYRKEYGESWSKIGTSATTSYTDTASLVNGEIYYYTVRATNGSSISGFVSAGVSAEYIPAPKLSSAVKSGTSIIVKWSEVNGAASYAVYRKAAGDSSWTKLGTTTSTSYTDSTSKTSGTTYYYTVKAKEDGTWGCYNNTGISVKY